MPLGPHPRRRVLGGAAVFYATASLGLPYSRAAAQSKQSLNGSTSQVDAALRRSIDAGQVPGVVAIAGTDRGIIYEGAFGKRDLVKGPEMTRDPIFRLASMTKAGTSVAAKQQGEKGHV